MRNVFQKVLFFGTLFLALFSSPIRSQHAKNEVFIQLMHGDNSDRIESYLFSLEPTNNDLLSVLGNQLQNNTHQSEMKYLGRYAAAKSVYNSGNHLLARTAFLSLLKELRTVQNTDHYVQLKHAVICTLFFLENQEGNYQDGLAYIQQYDNDLDPECFNFIYGVSKIELGDFVTGIEMLKQQLYRKTAPSAHHNRLYADYCNNIGDGCIQLFLKEQKAAILDTAALYYKKAYQFMANDKVYEHHSAALLQLRQARILFLKGKVSEALTLYTQAESDFQFKQPATLQAIYNDKADCYSKLDHPAIAIQWCDSFLRSYEKSPGTKKNLLQVYHLLSLNYEKLNQVKEANKYMRLIFGEQKQLDSHRLAASGILHAMDLVQLKQQLQMQMEHQFTTKLLIGSAVVIFSVAGSFFFFFRKRKKLGWPLMATSKKPVKQHLNGAVEKLLVTTSIDNEKNILQKRAALYIETPKTDVTPPYLETIEMDSIAKLGTVLPATYLLRVQKGLTKFEDSKGYIEADLTLPKLARKLRTNTSYLSQYFNQHLQKGFPDYLNDLRIQYVLSELEHNSSYRQYTTKAIAEAAGYKNQVTFMNSFKKITGITLSGYIEKASR